VTVTVTAKLFPEIDLTEIYFRPRETATARATATGGNLDP
jgi:hypothetical protein